MQRATSTFFSFFSFFSLFPRILYRWNFDSIDRRRAVLTFEEDGTTEKNSLYITPNFDIIYPSSIRSFILIGCSSPLLLTAYYSFPTSFTSQIRTFRIQPRENEISETIGNNQAYVHSDVPRTTGRFISR